NLYQRGLENQLDIDRIGVEELKEIEPHVNGLGAIRVPQAGIVNYKQVSQKFAEIIKEHGREIKLNSSVEKIMEENNYVKVETSKETIEARTVINCAGLHSDRIARASGYQTDMQIVPFRGEYYKLVPEKRYLVKNLIYPVPNPKFPFLGDRKSTRLNSSHVSISYAVFCLKKKNSKYI